MTLKVRGFDLTFTVDYGPKILVDMQPAMIQRTVDDLLPRRGEAKQGFIVEVDLALKQALSQEDKGRLVWRGSSPTASSGWQAYGFWTVKFRDEKGHLRTSAAGLQVPRSWLGDELSVQAYVEAALKVRLQARKEWDRLDCSDSPRYFP